MKDVIYVDKRKTDDIGKIFCSSTDAPVIALRRDEEGFYPIYTSLTARDLNGADVPREVQESAVAATMFGWHSKAAKEAIDYMTKEAP